MSMSWRPHSSNFAETTGNFTIATLYPSQLCHNWQISHYPNHIHPNTSFKSIVELEYGTINSNSVSKLTNQGGYLGLQIGWTWSRSKPKRNNVGHFVPNGWWRISNDTQDGPYLFIRIL